VFQSVQEDKMKQNKTIILTLISLILVSIGSVYAEESQEAEHHDLSFHIFFPLSTTNNREDTSNINVSILYSRMGEVNGIDAGHGVSWISGDMIGIQGNGGVAFVGGDLHGVSGTGVASIVRGNVHGIQGSGVLNWAGGTMQGIQAAGVVNVAKEVQGMQVGVVNLSEEMHGMPVGLINISGNGGIQLSGWHSTLTEANTGVRFRAGSFYTLFGFGLKSDSYADISEALETAEEISHSLAFGISLPATGFFALNADAGVVNIDRDRLFKFDEGIDQIGFRGRAMIELRLFGGLSVFGGAGTAYMVDAIEEPEEGDIENGIWEDFYFLGGGIEF